MLLFTHTNTHKHTDLYLIIYARYMLDPHRALPERHRQHVAFRTNLTASSNNRTRFTHTFMFANPKHTPRAHIKHAHLARLLLVSTQLAGRNIKHSPKHISHSRITTHIAHQTCSREIGGAIAHATHKHRA